MGKMRIEHQARHKLRFYYSMFHQRYYQLITYYCIPAFKNLSIYRLFVIEYCKNKIKIKNNNNKNTSAMVFMRIICSCVGMEV